MEPRTRRGFLADVGKGMLVASVGPALATDLSLASPALAEEEPAARESGRLEPLVGLLEENSAEKALPLVVERLALGTELKDLVAAAALANARTFGGDDYVGFHAFMALAPSYQMARLLPAERRALPVLKVVYRSTNQMQGKASHEHDAPPAPATADRTALRAAMRAQEMEKAEGMLAGMVARSPVEAFNAVQALVQDDTDVHRTVLAYRAWDLLGLTGKAHAYATLRQSVRYCVGTERARIARGGPEPGIRAALPALLDKYRLVGRAPGGRSADDLWVQSLCDTLFTAKPAEAAEAVAAALGEGFSLDAVGEALSLAATRQVLRDPGRKQAYPGKPIGSVHGDSVGVHASDSMNAWRNMARVSDHHNALSGLVVAGYHLSAGASYSWTPLSADDVRERDSRASDVAAGSVLPELDAAIRSNDQARAAALARRYSALGRPVAPLFDLLLRYAVSEDGALHGEKYYHTVVEEFGRTRPALRWDHAVALARVTASEYGRRADGYEQACGLLKVSA